MTKAAHFQTGYIDTRTHCRLVHSFEAGGPLASALSSTFYIFSRNFFPPQTNITRVIFVESEGRGIRGARSNLLRQKSDLI